MQCATSLVMWLAAHPMGCVEEGRERKSECALRVIFLHACWTGERGEEDCEGCFPVSRRKLCHTSMHTHTRGMDAMSRGQGRGKERRRRLHAKTDGMRSPCARSQAPRATRSAHLGLTNDRLLHQGSCTHLMHTHPVHLLYLLHTRSRTHTCTILYGSTVEYSEYESIVVEVG